MMSEAYISTLQNIFIRVYKSKLFKDKEIRIENYLTNNIFNYNISEDLYEFIY